jgi:K+-transporting ATPase ATPase C chain
MLAQIRAALVMLGALTVITGIAYPLLVTAVAQAAMPGPANGSLIVKGDKAIGSSLIGQPIDDPRYFWSRPSGATPAYNAASSTGTNLGPTNPALTDAVKQRVAALRAADVAAGATAATGEVPVDLVTSSGSGLDPHISVAAALYQVPRVAKARHMDEAKVRALVDAHTAARQLRFLGEPGVNVLELDLALDEAR